MSGGDWIEVEELREEQNRLIKSLIRAYNAATARYPHIMEYIAIHQPRTTGNRSNGGGEERYECEDLKAESVRLGSMIPRRPY